MLIVDCILLCVMCLIVFVCLIVCVDCLLCVVCVWMICGCFVCVCDGDGDDWDNCFELMMC